MTAAPGENTRDLRALGQPHPAERGLTPDQREDSIRSFGRRCLIWGLAVFIFTIVSGLGAAVAADLSLFESEAGRLFGVLASFHAGALGTILIAFGGAERLHRPQRAMSRKELTELRANRLAIHDVQERVDTMLPIVRALPASLAAVEAVIHKVPGYSEGVVAGIQVRGDALGPDNDRN